MDIKRRIRHRLQDGDQSLIHRPELLNPTVHLADPVNRSLALEELLDVLDPVFNEGMPPNAHVYGPPGSGKSAVVSALFETLNRHFYNRSARNAIYTRTRTRQRDEYNFVYVDVRRNGTDFLLFRTILNELVDDDVPRRGIGLNQVRSTLADRLAIHDRNVVVAVDHVGEMDGIDREGVDDLFSSFEEPSLRWVTIGRSPAPSAPATVEFEPYQIEHMTEILLERASKAFPPNVVDHQTVRRVAERADGNCEIAITCVLAAAIHANLEEETQIDDHHLEDGLSVITPECVPLSQVLSLSETKKEVIDAVLEISHNGHTVQRTADILDRRIDLSAGTIERLLYELANQGAFARVTSNQPANGTGRPPSYIMPRFPTLPYRYLRRGEHDQRLHEHVSL